MSVPLDIAADENDATKRAAAVNPDTPHMLPSRFVGIHACDGLALQQNIKTAHLSFNTLSIDERPSEYLAPLIQLHGDEQMDRICQGSGRGLTTYSEDIWDRGENERIYNTIVEDDDDDDRYSDFSWQRLHTHKGQRRTFTGEQFTEDSSWVRDTLDTVE